MQHTLLYYKCSCDFVFLGLGESWGQVSRSTLDGVSQELGSHLLQVFTSGEYSQCRNVLYSEYK